MPETAKHLLNNKVDYADDPELAQQQRLDTRITEEKYELEVGARQRQSQWDELDQMNPRQLADHMRKVVAELGQYACEEEDKERARELAHTEDPRRGESTQ